MSAIDIQPNMELVSMCMSSIVSKTYLYYTTILFESVEENPESIKRRFVSIEDKI